MDIKVKDLSYGTLISHTFPGYLFGFQIAIPFKLFGPTDIINNLIYSLLKLDYIKLIIVIIFSFIIATIFGSILDSIHNILFWKYDKKTLQNDIEIIKKIPTDQVDIYKLFLEYDPWYLFESYANIGIALTPGVIFLPWWLYKLGFTNMFIFIFGFIYILMIIILFIAAIIYCKEANKIETALIERFN